MLKIKIEGDKVTTSYRGREMPLLNALEAKTRGTLYYCQGHAKAAWQAKQKIIAGNNFASSEYLITLHQDGTLQQEINRIIGSIEAMKNKKPGYMDCTPDCVQYTF